MVPSDVDAKALNVAIDAVLKRSALPTLLIGSEGGKASALAVVPKGGSVDAKAWLAAALGACGGKGGGKADRAQGTGGDPAKVDEALLAAVKFVESS